MIKLEASGQVMKNNRRHARKFKIFFVKLPVVPVS